MDIMGGTVAGVEATLLPTSGDQERKRGLQLVGIGEDQDNI